MGGVSNTHREMRNAYKVLVGKPGRSKVKSCLTKHHAMKAYWGVEV